jgi:hypothetical protein
VKWCSVGVRDRCGSAICHGDVMARACLRAGGVRRAARADVPQPVRRPRARGHGARGPHRAEARLHQSRTGKSHTHDVQSMYNMYVFTKKICIYIHTTHTLSPKG